LLPQLLGIGFGVGLFSGFFGIGGGFLIVPGLMPATGMPLTFAVGTSLVAVAAFGAATAASYAISGLIDWWLAGLFVLGGLLGAGQQIVTLSGEEAVKLIGNPAVVFVDVREGEELQKSGKVLGAVHVPRGFLEFQVDPTSPTHKPELGDGRRLVLYCASGNRSALSAKALQDMGIGSVVHVARGFGALQQAGAPIEGLT
jgi:rhodanese-related sulfurtransferase